MLIGDGERHLRACEGEEAAAPGSERTFGGAGPWCPLDTQKQTIDNLAIHCYSSTTTVICIFVDDEVTDISRFTVRVKSPESASHPNLNVMCC
jgi:hypothetical protein